MGISAIAVLACETLLSLYREMFNTLKDMIKRIKKLLRKVVNMFTIPFEKILKQIMSYIDFLKNINFDFRFGLQDLIDAIDLVFKCPILDAMIGTTARGLMDAIKKGLDLPKTLFENFKNMIVAKISAFMASIYALVNNPLSKMMNKLNGFMSGSFGLNYVLNFMNDIEKCLGFCCKAGTKVKMLGDAIIADPWAMLGFVKDGKDGHKFDPEGAISKTWRNLKNKVTDSATTLSDTCSKQFDELKKALSDFKDKPIIMPPKQAKAGA